MRFSYCIVKMVGSNYDREIRECAAVVEINIRKNEESRRFGV